MIEKLGEIAAKVFSLGKLLVPAVAIFELVRRVFGFLAERLLGWLAMQALFWWAKVVAQFDALNVDLTPSPVVMGYVAKINSVVPLDVMWHYLLLYLGIASVFLGVKWARNLIPGLK